MSEKLCRPEEIAEMFGVSTAFVRDACFRGKDYHRLPAIDIGTGKRHCFRIRPSAFEEWLKEEEETR